MYLNMRERNLDRFKYTIIKISHVITQTYVITQIYILYNKNNPPKLHN